MIQKVLNIGVHWSPLELEIEKRDMAELIQMLLTIGAHWSPLELEIVKIHVWADHADAYHWSPVESIGVED